jgi:hypothetical protein
MQLEQKVKHWACIEERSIDRSPNLGRILRRSTGHVAQEKCVALRKIFPLFSQLHETISSGFSSKKVNDVRLINLDLKMRQFKLMHLPSLYQEKHMC